MNVVAIVALVSLGWLNQAREPVLSKFTKVDKGSVERRDPNHLLTNVLRGIVNREF